MGETVKINASLVKIAKLSKGNNTNRYFDLSAVLTDGTTVYLDVDNDTIKVVTNKDGTWTDVYALATKTDLTDKAKKISKNFLPGTTELDISSWSSITLLSLVTYKDEATALYLIRKESSTSVYCVPVKSSTFVSVAYSSENKLTLTDSAKFGGTWSVLFLS